MITATALPLPTLPMQQEQAQTPRDPLQYISASRLKTFGTCRLQFYFRYVANLPSPSSPALFVGKSVHHVLQAWNIARWRQEDASIPRMQQVFDACWVTGCEEEEMIWESHDQEAKEKAKAWNILEHYLENTPIPVEEKPQAVEVKVQRDFMAAGLPPLLGIIDLVRANGKIVDFKTAARTPTPLQAEHQNELQMCCYCVLYREATGQKESGVELHHLIKTKVPKLVISSLAPMSPDQGRRLMAVMESYVRGVEGEDFVPCAGQHCGWCDYFTECRQWNGGAA